MPPCLPTCSLSLSLSRYLIPGVDFAQLASALYNAPFVCLAHNKGKVGGWVAARCWRWWWGSRHSAATRVLRVHVPASDSGLGWSIMRHAPKWVAHHAVERHMLFTRVRKESSMLPPLPGCKSYSSKAVHLIVAMRLRVVVGPGSAGRSAQRAAA